MQTGTSSQIQITFIDLVLKLNDIYIFSVLNLITEALS